MNLLITGGAGFVGSNLIAELQKNGGHNIRVLDNESIGKHANIAEFDVEFVNGDIKDKKIVNKMMQGVDAVIHLAADTRVIDSITKPYHNFRDNVIGSFVLLESARELNVSKFINASTGGAILGEVKGASHEEIMPRPISPYGASKLAVEGYCSAYAGSYGMNTISLRFSNLYGPRSYHKGSVVAHFYNLISQNKELTIYGDGSQVRDYLYVSDLSKCIANMLSKEVTSGIYQLGSGQPTSLNQLIESIIQIAGNDYPVKVKYEKARKGEIHSTFCDISKAKKHINFNPKTSLNEGLQETWLWFLTNKP